MKNQNPVVWYEIYVDDLKRAKKFYESFLQIQFETMPTPGEDQSMQMLAFPGDMESKAAANGALVKMDGFPAGNNSTIVYFQSEDCSIEEARVEKAGGSVFQSKTSIGEHGFITLLKDSEGNMIGLHSMK